MTSISLKTVDCSPFALLHQMLLSERDNQVAKVVSVALPSSNEAAAPSKTALEPAAKSKSGLKGIVELIVGYLMPSDPAPDKEELLQLMRAGSTIASQTPYQLFWGLGQLWWKQIIDGKHHYIDNKMVYDLGLHGFQKEPGFIRNCENACRYASRAILEERAIGLEVYRQIHITACKHFRGPANATIMTAEGGGVFKSADLCISRLHRLFPLQDKAAALKRIECLNVFDKERTYDAMSSEARAAFLKKENTTHEAYQAKIDAEYDEYEILDLEVSNRIHEINKYIAKRSCDLGLADPIAKLERHGERVHVYYYGYSAEELKKAVENLFSLFHRNISSANTSEERLRCIADLFQMLEWLHPFEDGQGRTDLILLANLLCYYGFNPAILDEPYVSTLAMLDDWVVYLTRGLEKWRAEYERVRAPLLEE